MHSPCLPRRTRPGGQSIGGWRTRRTDSVCRVSVCQGRAESNQLGGVVRAGWSTSPHEFRACFGVLIRRRKRTDAGDALACETTFSTKRVYKRSPAWLFTRGGIVLPTYGLGVGLHRGVIAHACLPTLETWADNRRIRGLFRPADGRELGSEPQWGGADLSSRV